MLPHPDLKLHTVCLHYVQLAEVFLELKLAPNTAQQQNWFRVSIGLTGITVIDCGYIFSFLAVKAALCIFIIHIVWSVHQYTTHSKIRGTYLFQGHKQKLAIWIINDPNNI